MKMKEKEKAIKKYNKLEGKQLCKKKERKR